MRKTRLVYWATDDEKKSAIYYDIHISNNNGILLVADTVVVSPAGKLFHDSMAFLPSPNFSLCDPNVA